MEALGNSLSPYSELLGQIAGAVTCLQFLSGIVFINEIRVKGSSDIYPVLPFLGGIVLSVLSLKLGQVMNDPATIQVNIIGLVISCVFFYAFFHYASSAYRTQLWIKLGYASIFTGIVYAYAGYEDPEKIELRLGLLITVILFVMVGAPLLDIKEIIRTKNTERLPFPMILAGNICSVAWLLYGLSIHNTTIVFQNLLLGVLGGIQLALIFMYPGPPKATTKKTSEKAKKDN